MDEKVKNPDKLEELLRALEDRADDLTAPITNDEEKSIYNELYKLTEDVISQTEKEIKLVKESLASKLLNTSRTLESYSQKAKNKSAGCRLLALSKELYKYCGRSRKHK